MFANYDQGQDHQKSSAFVGTNNSEIEDDELENRFGDSAKIMF